MHTWDGEVLSLQGIVAQALFDDNRKEVIESCIP
jgi:hypothetical protein